MKKTVQTVLLKKKKNFILLFPFAAILFLGFLCISAIYRDRGCKTETADMTTFLAESRLDSELSHLINEDEEQINGSISTTENLLFDQMNKDLTSITAYLEDLKETVERNRDKILDLTINQKKSDEELTQGRDTLEQNLSDEVKKLMEQLDQVNNDITGTQKEIMDVLKDINNTDLSRMETILEKFTGINNNLTEINVSVDKTHEELTKLIVSVKTGGEEKHKELLSVLEKLNASFSEENTSNFDTLLISLQTQTDTLKAQFENINHNLSSGFRQIEDNVTIVNQEVSDTKTEVLEGLKKVDANVGQNYNAVTLAIAGSKAEVMQKLESMAGDNIEYFASVKQEISGGREAITERIDSMESKMDIRLNNLDNSLQSVFQSVSDGKKLLATALLTKNVTVADDAAFAELQQAILAVPQKIVIGTEQVPGEIEYTYHYHTGDAINGEGCFTTRLYHQHSANCYTKATCQPYCLGLTHTSRNDNWDLHENSRFMHPDCGMGIIYRSPKHFVGDPCNCDKMSSHTYDKLSCGKTNATPEGWAAGCGFVDGQIIEVHIVYNADTAEIGSPNAILQSQKEYIPHIYDDYTEVSRQPSEEKNKETEQESIEVPVETEQMESMETSEEKEQEMESLVQEQETFTDNPTETE